MCSSGRSFIDRIVRFYIEDDSSSMKKPEVLDSSAKPGKILGLKRVFTIVIF
ncbi:hypothetical protein [Leptospira barantonii]|uniref:hypothetical protein n=1 Tax=Leptospira barantonii TaxID=2023184 RepID=UPI0013FDB1E5|nr:hypothetical protein [Leptospira barantonii]